MFHAYDNQLTNCPLPLLIIHRQRLGYRFLNQKLKKFRTIKSYVAKVLDFAIKRGYIQTKPFDHVDMPVALNWKDISFTDTKIHINKVISRGKDNQLYLKSTKTGIARTIAMDSHKMAILKEWQKKQKEDYFKLVFNTKSPNQLVFSNEYNEFLQPTKTRKWIIQVQKKYNLKEVSTYGLRHTHCSLLFEAEAKIKEVQGRLGHSDIQTTMNIYAHVTAKAKKVPFKNSKSI